MGVGPVVVQVRLQGGVQEVNGRVRTVRPTALDGVPTQHQQDKEGQHQDSKEHGQDGHFHGLISAEKAKGKRLASSVTRITGLLGHSGKGSSGIGTWV